MRTLTVLIAATLASAALADVQQAVLTAQSLVGQKQYEKAKEVIRTAALECGEGDAGKVCFANVSFTLGYIYAISGDLESAETEYRKTLDFYSDNVAARSNLADVLARRGKAEDAATELGTAAKYEPSNASRFYFAAAETLYTAGKFKRAIEYYKYATATGSPDAPQRLVSALAQWVAAEEEGDEREDVLETALDIGHDLRRRGSTGAAISAYELVMANRTDAGDSRASDALYAWTEARSATRSLTPDSLAALPSAEAWSSPFLQGLRSTVSGKEWSFPTNALSSDFAQYSAASAARAVADDLVAAKDLTPAKKLYKGAIAYAPTPAKQEENKDLKWRPVIYLDSVLQLGRISTSTRDDALFTEVEALFRDDALFSEKDPSGTQRAHTVIGAIYAEQLTLDPTSRKAETYQRRAIEQFESALRVAEERKKKDGVPQSLPQVHMRLAQSYRVQQDFLSARKHEIAAAQDYLDLDAITPASQSLQRALLGPAPLTPEDKSAIQALQQITSYRASIPNLKSFNTLIPKWELEAAPGSLIDDTDFVARQWFKTSADLGRQAERIGNQLAAKSFYKSAKEQANENKNLVLTTSDKLRYWQVENGLEDKPWKKKDPKKLWKSGLEEVESINVSDDWTIPPGSN